MTRFFTSILCLLVFVSCNQRAKVAALLEDDEYSKKKKVEDKDVLNLKQSFEDIEEHDALFAFPDKSGALRPNTTKYEDVDYKTSLRYKKAFANTKKVETETVAFNEDTIDYGEYEDPEKLYNQGIQFMYANKKEEALKKFNKAIHEDHNYFEAYFKRGEVRYQMEDYQGALKDFEVVARADVKKDLRKLAHVHSAEVEEKIGEVNDALVHYDLAIQIDPEYEDAYVRRGLAHERLQMYEDAIKDYTLALEHDTSNVKVYYKRGRCYQETGQFYLATQDYTAVIDRRPNFTSSYFYRGMVKFEQRQFRAGIKDFTSVIQLNPKDEEAFFNRGLLYFELGEYENAMRDFDRAVLLDPKDADAHINKALCRYRKGEVGEAVDEFEKVLKMDPDNVDAHINVGIIKLEQETYSEAKKDFDKVLAIDHENGEAFYYRGMCNMELENKRNACLDFEMAKKFEFQGSMHMIRMYCNNKSGN